MSKLWYFKTEKIVDIANDLRLVTINELQNETLKEIYYQIKEHGEKLYSLIREVEKDIEKLVKENESK